MDNETGRVDEIGDLLYKMHKQKQNNQPEITQSYENKHIKRKLEKGGYKIDSSKLYFLSKNIPFGLDKVEVKKSKVHGYGVFSKKNILKGELITFYPGDFVEFYPKGDKIKDNHMTSIIRSERFEKHFGDTTDTKFRDNNYSYDLNKHYSIIGSPHFKGDPNYMGHFINDGAKSNSTKKSNEIYKTITMLKANCIFHNLKEDLHVAVVSTKKIKRGEELFISYGLGYWKSYNKNNLKL